MKIRNNDLSNRRIDIDISDGVSIHLYKEEYDELIKLLLPEMIDQVNFAKVRDEKTMKLREEIFEFIRKIRNVFYIDNDSDFCLLKNIKDIDYNEMTKVLDEYSRMLGFE